MKINLLFPMNKLLYSFFFKFLDLSPIGCRNIFWMYLSLLKNTLSFVLMLKTIILLF